MHGLDVTAGVAGSLCLGSLAFATKAEKTRLAHIAGMIRFMWTSSLVFGRIRMALRADVDQILTHNVSASHSHRRAGVAKWRWRLTLIFQSIFKLRQLGR